MKMKLNKVFPDEYLDLRKRSGKRSVSKLAATGALKDSLLTVGIYENKLLIAFGRVCGDDSLLRIVTDVMVDRDYRNAGVEKPLIKEIDDYLRTTRTRDNRTLVTVDKEYEKLFKILGFKYFDEDVQSPMWR